MDPEIPTISMVDLGIVTSVETEPESNSATITLIPTFSGCPALKVMEDMVREKVQSLGVEHVDVSTNFDIPWTTDRITEKGKKGLLQHGLAPPPDTQGGLIELDVLSDVACPYCGSRNTKLTTPFGPTLCRSMHYCNNCLQAFEQFKPVG
ncbi:MAG: phenylacetate-CoA oxygenase subunit PaaJ [Bacteroidota bacterium]|nr:phenylacetate-CoA oxygenase subunit PaaJ [Bacteroidota bacterium]MDX5431661.1 phenylacetate-CoA oxygenase subunit PaaJ [Bacteroidota bacterium]MDX5470379.1 phenylacetate-CoA oxygenase subunit PaaJ [Bacteroidota bacterium]